MKIINIITIFFTSTFLSNCTPAWIVKDSYPIDTKTSKVKITREDSYDFMAIPAIFGYDKKDKLRLWKGDVLELDVPVGKQELFVRSNQADRPFKFNIEIKENELLCLTIHPELKPYIKFILFPFFFFSHAFKMEKSEFCK
jgi:hypothetical protein